MSTSRQMAERLSAIRRAALKLCDDAHQFLNKLPTERAIQLLNKAWPFWSLSPSRSPLIINGEDAPLREQMRELLQAVRDAEPDSFYWPADIRAAFKALRKSLIQVCRDWDGRCFVRLPGGAVSVEMDIETSHLRELAGAANALPIKPDESAGPPPKEDKDDTSLRRSPATPKSRRRRGGRPPDTDPMEDRRIAEAWKTGAYGSHEDLAREFGMTKQEVKRALDRHRHRESGGKTRPRKPRQED